MISRVLIVDDEPLARERLSELTRRLAPTAALREAGNGTDAITLIGSWRPDVVLLDIQMPGGTGFEVIDAVGVDRMPATLFISAHDEFALQAFDVAAVDYLLKPFDDARFAIAWRRLTDRVATGRCSNRLAFLARCCLRVAATTRVPCLRRVVRQHPRQRAPRAAPAICRSDRGET